jgi:hypothetical protein
MPVVQFKQTAHACQVEGFPSSVPSEEKPKEGEEQKTRTFERTVDGALHLRPGGTLVLTADEFGWLKATKPQVFKNLLVLAEDPPPPAKVDKAPKKKGDPPPPPAG